jgi:hypothetical protein
MGNTKYYTLCENKHGLVLVLRMIQHHNTPQNEDMDVGETLYDIRYVEISDAMKSVSTAKKYAKFRDARYLITSVNQGGRSSTRPYFEGRGIDPDANRFIPPKLMKCIDDHEDTTIGWKTSYQSCKILHEEGGIEKLNTRILEMIDALTPTPLRALLEGKEVAVKDAPEIEIDVDAFRGWLVRNGLDVHLERTRTQSNCLKQSNLRLCAEIRRLARQYGENGPGDTPVTMSPTAFWIQYLDFGDFY